MLHGVIVYEILPDGCLNGVYSNDGAESKNKMFNEIARKHPDKGNANSDGKKDPIFGTYACCYIDIGNEVCPCDLEIRDSPKLKRGQYHFIWTKNGRKIFEGSGWKTRENQITVSYRDGVKK